MQKLRQIRSNVTDHHPLEHDFFKGLILRTGKIGAPISLIIFLASLRKMGSRTPKMLLVPGRRLLENF